MISSYVIYSIHVIAASFFYSQNSYLSAVLAGFVWVGDFSYCRHDLSGAAFLNINVSPRLVFIAPPFIA